jgi:hypothetical protein
MKTRPSPQCAIVLVALAGALALGAGCKASNAPDPASFGPAEEAKVDSRKITFYNGSVEMAHLEIFAPAATIKDCQAEAPHRLLCPTDYKHILDKRVYPRTSEKATYPANLPLECGQVWIRVHTKAMQAAENREAIFLLPGEGEQLVLELGEGEAAHLGHKGFGTRYRFPAPVRYCDADQPSVVEPPKETIRPLAQVTKALAGVKPALAACCKPGPCNGVLRVSLTLHRDGSVSSSDVVGGVRVGSKQSKQHACLLDALGKAHFPGFTKALSTAEVTLRLPPR